MIGKYDQSFHMRNKVLTTIWALHFKLTYMYLSFDPGSSRLSPAWASRSRCTAAASPARPTASCPAHRRRTSSQQTESAIWLNTISGRF